MSEFRLSACGVLHFNAEYIHEIDFETAIDRFNDLYKRKVRFN